jgi:hypothetical protein
MVARCEVVQGAEPAGTIAQVQWLDILGPIVDGTVIPALTKNESHQGSGPDPSPDEVRVPVARTIQLTWAPLSWQVWTS